MFISPAYAQDAGAGGLGGIEALLPLVLIFVVFYFLLIRPQQKKMKQHKEMLGAIRRGDKVVTGGGIMGAVTKVGTDGDLTVEIAEGVRVRVQQSLVSTVLSKTEPGKGAPAGGAAPAGPGQGGGSFIEKIFGGGRR
ncbi:MAG: preprotein translocase subunit YajC [Rhodospirillales bacterium]|jgi:preprotein translocase subunit YajC|nr:preprotein translocase subunit YajC [Rhodospirillales bacterium]